MYEDGRSVRFEEAKTYKHVIQVPNVIHQLEGDYDHQPLENM